jgi:hypothetical protein
MKETETEILKQKMQQKALVKKKKHIEVRDAKIQLKKSRTQLKKLRMVNEKIDRTVKRTETRLGMIKRRLTMTSTQLRILTRKKEFLLNDIRSLKGHEKKNRAQMTIENAIVRELKCKLFC